MDEELSRFGVVAGVVVDGEVDGVDARQSTLIPKLDARRNVALAQRLSDLLEVTVGVDL